MKHIKIFLLCLFLAAGFRSTALTLSPGAEISILTCSPGDELYSLFGHTAIRLQDSSQNIDVVFNYGTFDFRTEHFYLKYAQGLLPYQLATSSYGGFINSYIEDGRSVWSQTLQLSQKDKQRLTDLLLENLEPVNRTYLYNFLFDNCSTRVRDMIGKSSLTPVTWQNRATGKNFWNLLDEYLYRMPWVKWGIHTILGQPGNREATSYEYMFLPDYLLQGIETASLNGKLLSAPVETLYQAPVQTNNNRWYFSPLLVFSISTILIIWLLQRCTSEKALRLIAIPLFLTTGLIGCLLVFLGFFTEHPITAPNYNLIWANPLNLVVIPFLFRKRMPVLVGKYLSVYTIILAIGILLWFFLLPAVPIASFPLLILMLFISLKLKINSDTNCLFTNLLNRFKRSGGKS